MTLHYLWQALTFGEREYRDRGAGKERESETAAPLIADSGSYELRSACSGMSVSVVTIRLFVIDVRSVRS